MAEWVKLEDYEAYLSKKENAKVRITSPKNKDFCSNCWDDFNWIRKPNYCPHCGAKMSNTEEVIPYHRNDIIEELEDVKAKILDTVSMYDGYFLIEPKYVENIIDQRVCELKGE